jgi:hypothetical protein
MAIAFTLSTLACLFGVWRAEAKDTRVFMAVCLALNIVALVWALASGDTALRENPWNTCEPHCL